MKIEFLEDRKELINPLAKEIRDQWNDMYNRQNKSEADVANSYKARAISNRIPLTMIATDGDEIIGSITIKENDFSHRPDLNPWIAAVFVREKYRGNGYAKELLSFAENVALTKFSMSKIYLYTGSAEGLYLKTGYSIIETVKKNDKTYTIMEKIIND